MQEADPLHHALAHGLGLGGPQVGGGGIHVHGPSRPGSQKRLVERAHAAPHVQHRGSRYALGGEVVYEDLSGFSGAASTMTLHLGNGQVVIEDLLDTATLQGFHRFYLSPER